MSSCTRRNRRNRRAHGGSAALNEAFADLKGNGAPPKMDVPPPNGANGANGAQKGGRRKSRKSRKSGKSGKSRKMSKGATAWTTAVTKLYREMKAKDKSAKFSDALKRASVLKKKGQL